MPVTWQFRDSVLIVTLVGLCGDQVTAAINEAMADPAFEAGTSLLLDVRLCQDDPTAADFRRRARILGARRDRGLSSRCAVVTGPSPYQFGVARMASAYSEIQDVHLEIFVDLENALEWLQTNSLPETQKG